MARRTFVDAGHEPNEPNFGSLDSNILEERALPVLQRWRDVAEFTCAVVVQDGAETVESILEANPGSGAWRVQYDDHRPPDSYDPLTETAVLDGEEQKLQVDDSVFEPFPVRLAFPESLRLWGRVEPAWLMLGAFESSDEYVVLLQHSADKHFFGSLTVNKSLGQATRLDIPGLSIHYRNVEPLA